MQFNKTNEYAQYLQKIYLSENQQERKYFQDLFQQLSVQDNDFSLNLINILQIDQYDNKIQQASLLYIKTYIKEICEANSQDFLKIQSTVLINSIISNQLQTRHKLALNDGLKNICLASNQNNSIMKNISEQIILSFNNSSQVNSFVGGFLLFQTLFKINTSDHYAEIQKDYMKQFCNAGANLLSYIQNIFNQQINVNQIDFTLIVEILNILQIWGQTFLKVITKFTKIKKKNKKIQKELMKQFLSDMFVTNLLSQILKLSFNNQNQIKECIISCTNISQIDQGLNEIKTTILEIYTKLYQYIQDYQSKDQINTNFIIYNQQVMIYVYNSLHQYCIKQNLFQQFQDRYLEELFIKLLQYLIHSMQPENYNLFCLYKNQIIIHILFPLLLTSTEELELFETNPLEFVNLALDTCDKQTSNTIKTTAAKLLECFCDNVDGATTLTCNFSIQIINYSIFFDDPNNIDIQFPFLIEFKNSVFVDKNFTSPEQRIDTCFVVLSIISYLLQNRNDLISNLETTIKQNKDNLFSIQLKNILKSRFCLLLGYFADSIFSQQQDLDMFHLCIEFLVTSTLNEQRGVSYQAIDSLSNIYDDDQMSQKLSQTVKPVFSKLIQNIIHSQFEQFMDLIQNITKLFQKDLQEDQILQCVCFLVERIQIEYNSKQKEKIFLNKCFNIIIEIVGIDNYIPKCLIGVDVSLRPLINYLQFPDQYGFEDDILQIIGILLKKSKIVTENMYNYLCIFPQIFKRKNQIFGKLFPILYYSLIYGQQIFIQQPQLLQQIIIMAEQAMMNDHTDSNEADNAQGALLIQVIVQYFSNLLGSVWDEILQKVYERITNNIESDFLKGRLLGVYISGFLSNFSIVQQKLNEQGILDKIIDHFVTDINYYMVSYDARLFIIGMSQILLEQTLMNQFMQKLPQIFDFIVTLLKRQQAIDNQISQKKKKQQEEENESQKRSGDEDIQQNSLDQEIFDDIDSGCIDDDVYELSPQAQKMDKKNMESLNNQLNGIDEFEHFRQIINQVKIKSEQSLQKLIQTLSISKQEYLKCVLKTHRISIQDAPLRKIVKVKKRA